MGTLIAPEHNDLFGLFGILFGLAVAVTMLVRRSRNLSPKERRSWLWIGSALGSMWVGVFLVGALSAAEVNLPAFGGLDVFFLGAYVMLVVGVYRLTRLDSGGQEWVLTVVDALVGGIALAALVWNLLFTELMSAMSGAPWWEAAIATVYPVADVTLVVCLLILVMRRSNYHLDLRLVFLAIGAGTQVLADFLYLTDGIGQDFISAEPAWAVNLIATIFLVLTAAIVDRVPRKREFPEAPTPMWAVVWPYLLAASLMAVHFDAYRKLNPGTDEILLLDAVVLIGVVVILRQVYVIVRDRHRVDRKRAELVASVSHELRTPLTAMVGFLTLLDDHPDEFPADARQEMIAEAADQARHMSRLVSDLLMLAKGDTSHLTLEVKEVRALSIVTSVLRNTDPSETRIEQELDAEVVVRVDPDRMKQALGNLLTNAIRYGGDRCLVVASAEGKALTLEVHDNGPGVPTRFESIIWNHFERGAHRLDATTPGLGIGLSIVQAVMESHGGRADYRVSERLGGACFTLTVPESVVTEESVSSRVTART
ncbi:MAG TPA: ATP-binding protein [Acidimicrobiia bacterium]|nr:ATP-binding protein [Acidimicrobiia bacterium]